MTPRGFERNDKAEQKRPIKPGVCAGSVMRRKVVQALAPSSCGFFDRRYRDWSGLAVVRRRSWNRQADVPAISPQRCTTISILRNFRHEDKTDRWRCRNNAGISRGSIKVLECRHAAKFGSALDKGRGDAQCHAMTAAARAICTLKTKHGEASLRRRSRTSAAYSRKAERQNGVFEKAQPDDKHQRRERKRRRAC